MRQRETFTKTKLTKWKNLSKRFRGYSIPRLRELLPKGNGTEPLPEGLFWLMLVNEIPSEEDVKWWTQRSNVPEHTFKALDSLSPDTHPMTQFVVAISSMQSTGIFARRYAEGLGKGEYWEPVYEDVMNPRIAAYIYRRTYHNGDHISPDISLDWAANFAHMLGNDSEDFKNLMRLYLTIHADHEGGNASAHTTHLVNSTLSDPYLSFAAGMTALAGPLHGLANQEVVKWITNMLDALMAQKVFAEEHLPDDKMVQVVWKVFEVVPPILQSLGKVKNPWPNVDAHSGALLMHYGIKEYSFYTVLFGVSRALGVLASICWSRALGLPLERPKSVNSK